LLKKRQNKLLEKSWNKVKIMAKNKLTEHSTLGNISDWLRSLVHV